MATYKVTYNENGFRVDKVLSIFNTELSRTAITKIINDGNCKVNGVITKASFKVKTNDIIDIDIPETKPLKIEGEDIPLDIVYEDDDILIINKPQGMVVHPACGHWEHTLVNAIVHHSESLSDINGVTRPGIVHRIDKDTSGLICIAKNDKAHMFLADQLSSHTMQRTYLAILRGVINENEGTIDIPLLRGPNREKMVANAKGKPSITHFKVLERYKNHTLVQCNLETGRTHQIRAHFAHIGFPVEGDVIYGGKAAGQLYQNGQLLVAVELKLIHPTNKKEMVFKINPPQYFQEIINKLK